MAHGDVLSKDPQPAELDAPKVKQAADAAFASAAEMTAAFVVTWKGRIIAESTERASTCHTPLESWSMGKSLTATLMGVSLSKASTTCCSRRPFRLAGRGRSARQDPDCDILHIVERTAN